MVYVPNWKDALRDRNEHAYKMLGDIQSQGDYSVRPDPEYDYFAKAEEIAYNAYNNPPVAPQSAAGATGKNVASNQLRAFINAIAAKESGGNYGAVNPDSGAMGKYQIMPSNITGSAGWDMEALGRNITTQQFLSNPKLQEAIARFKLKQYYGQYGIRGAASAWYSGSPDRWKEKTPQGDYPSVYHYVMDILERMGVR